MMLRGSGTDIAYAALPAHRLQVNSAISLHACYAMPGTDLSHATRLLSYLLAIHHTPHANLSAPSLRSHSLTNTLPRPSNKQTTTKQNAACGDPTWERSCTKACIRRHIRACCRWSSRAGRWYQRMSRWSRIWRRSTRLPP
eukprot:2043071-Rhodomonas_salina.1